MQCGCAKEAPTSMDYFTTVDGQNILSGISGMKTVQSRPKNCKRRLTVASSVLQSLAGAIISGICEMSISYSPCDFSVISMRDFSFISGSPFIVLL